MHLVKRFASQIFNGLASMHELGISHRDLKPENVLLKEGQVRICDVGASKVLDDAAAQPSPMNTPYVVSRYYRAPELILGSHRYDTSIDVWAAGCIIFELLTRRPLFPGESEGIQLVEIQQVIGKPSETEVAHLSTAMKVEAKMLDMLAKLTDLERNATLDMKAMLKCCDGYVKHGMYTLKDVEDCADLIQRCLNWTPSSRITAKDALNHPFCSTGQTE